jgi:hypothetical protein
MTRVLLKIIWNSENKRIGNYLYFYYCVLMDYYVMRHTSDYVNKLHALFDLINGNRCRLR